MQIRSKLATFIASAAVAATILGAGATAQASGLKDYPAAGYVPVGAVARAGNLPASGQSNSYGNTLSSEFNLTGAENDLKMYIWQDWNGDPMTGSPKIDWSGPDKVAQFARDHGMRMRGHCLVYHSVVPGFLCPTHDNSSSPYNDTQIQHMVQVYIATVMQRYADVIDYWDVTNEMFQGDGNIHNTWPDYGNGGRQTNDFWLQHLGGYNVSTYMNRIFGWARAAVPNCKLYYNDFGTEYPGTEFNGMLSTLTNLRNNGCPIDGIGFQCHENTNSPGNVLSTQNTQAVDNAGFQWQVTECDVQSGNTPDVQSQNRIYSGITNICTNDRNCRGMMMWGFSDGASWLNPANGLPFDGGFNRKDAYWAIDYMYHYAPTLAPAGYMYACGEGTSKTFNTPVDIAFGVGNSNYFYFAKSGTINYSYQVLGDPAYGQAKYGYFHDFTWAANEGGSVTVSVPVEAAYGANGSYWYNWGTSGTIYFNNGSWGGDPKPYYGKSGFYMPYTYATGEWNSFNLPGTCDVAYGANGHYLFRHAVSGTVTFSNSAWANIGPDPAPGVGKSGYYRPSH